MSYVMTASELIAKLVHIANDLDTSYLWGGIGQYLGNNAWGFDCSGLIKGIMWGFDDQPYEYGGAIYGANGVPDKTALEIKNMCDDLSTSFSAILPGEFLYLQREDDAPSHQHCGIYIGNGYAVESTPDWQGGVQISTVQNLVNNRPQSKQWMVHGKLPWIDYNHGLTRSGTDLYLKDENGVNKTGTYSMVGVFDELTGVLQNVF